MSTGFYNLLTFIDNVYESYERKYEENKEEKKDNIDNIRRIRDVLNIRNINDDYNNNRYIISNLFRNNRDRDNDNNSNSNHPLSSIISLFVTNYMNGSYNENNNEDNNNEDNNNEDNNNEDNDIDLSVCLYTDLDKDIKEKNENCSICFERNDCDDTLILTKCFHVYHYNCIKKWVDINKTCPLCRTALI